MAWLEHHKNSEALASAAHAAKKEHDLATAHSLFLEAGRAEKKALEFINPKEKSRTFSVTAVSAASLFYKGGDLRQAEMIAYSCLANDSILDFAADQLRDILQVVWNERAQAEAGIQFVPGQVSVTVGGGEVVRGGAPLDLILEKVQTVQSIFIRTTEFLKQIPLRKRGSASKEIQDMCRPWLFQGVPGSYQFIVAIEGPLQLDFLEEQPIAPELIASTFMTILERAVVDPEEALVEVVPDPGYRSTFLKLTRNLAPSGKRFQQMQIRSTDSDKPLLLTSSTRKELADTIKKQRQVSNLIDDECTIKGVLRAVHLDSDWLEILAGNELVKITGVGEAVDDLIGPMVNHEVVVHTSRGKGGSLKFVDIEPC
jgi:hypothetical protein